MPDKPIFVTEHDLQRLRGLVKSSRESLGKKDRSLEELENELNRAHVVTPQEIPSDVVTMNSEVHLRDMNTGEETVYRIVFPHEADIDKGYVSILAPIGMALLGYSVGEIIEWKVPAGRAKWKVERILYQPEASGHYHL
jgi:regulator of nucleoside diphosphate kinase